MTITSLDSRTTVTGGIYNGADKERDCGIKEILNSTLVQAMISEVSSNGLSGRSFEYHIIKKDGKATVVLSGDREKNLSVDAYIDDITNSDDDSVSTYSSSESGPPVSSKEKSLPDEQKQKYLDAAAKVNRLAANLISRIGTGEARDASEDDESSQEPLTYRMDGSVYDAEQDGALVDTQDVADDTSEQSRPSFTGSEVQALRKQLEQERRAFRDLDYEAEMLGEERDTAAGDARLLQEEKQELADRITVLEDELDRVSDRDAIEQQLDLAKLDRDSAIEDAEHAVLDVEAQKYLLGIEQGKVLQLDTDLAATNAQNTLLAADNARLTREKDQQEQMIQNMAKNAQRVDRKMELLDDQESRIADLQRDYGRLQAEIKAKDEQVLALRTKVQMTTRAHRASELVKAQLEARVTEIEGLLEESSAIANTYYPRIVEENKRLRSVVGEDNFEVL